MGVIRGLVAAESDPQYAAELQLRMHEVLSHLPRMVHTASLTCLLILVDCLLQDVHISGRGIFLNAFSKLQCPVNLLLRIVLYLEYREANRPRRGCRHAALHVT